MLYAQVAWKLRQRMSTGVYIIYIILLPSVNPRDYNYITLLALENVIKLAENRQS